jgi:hypothetical protein
LYSGNKDRHQAINIEFNKGFLISPVVDGSSRPTALEFCRRHGAGGLFQQYALTQSVWFRYAARLV